MDTFSGLYDKLMKINWDYKSSLYESYYDYSEVVNIERNPSISALRSTGWVPCKMLVS